jgi:hypothetical protein
VFALEALDSFCFNFFSSLGLIDLLSLLPKKPTSFYGFEIERTLFLIELFLGEFLTILFCKRLLPDVAFLF